MSRAEPKWLHLEVVLAIQEAMLRLHGGLAGVRDMGLLESALARPEKLFAYERSDIFALAASYAVGIAGSHPFHDGNKRTAFVAAVTFLEENGYRLEAPEDEAVVQMISLTQRRLSEAEFGTWLQDKSRPVAGSTPVKRSKKRPKSR